MPGCNTPDQQNLIIQARKPLTVYEDMAELIRLGAYKAGTNPEVDNAVRLYPSSKLSWHRERPSRRV